MNLDFPDIIVIINIKFTNYGIISFYKYLILLKISQN